MKAINVDGQMTAKELLSLVDGYYKLEKPIGYTMGKTSSTTGEISGVININTDVKVLDGITKVITSLADDTSYYIENVWQDGDALEVSAMDETSGGDEGGGGSGGKTANVTFKNSGTGSYTFDLPLVYPSLTTGCLARHLKIDPNAVGGGIVPLFDGSAYVLLNAILDLDYNTPPEIEGDCVVDGVDYTSFLRITGDCTITLAGTGTN